MEVVDQAAPAGEEYNPLLVEAREDGAVDEEDLEANPFLEGEATSGGPEEEAKALGPEETSG